MQAIVARVGLRIQGEVLPGLENGMTQGRCVRRLRVRATEDLAPEVCPAEAVGVPLDLIEVDARAWDGELRAHPCIEAVDDVDAIDLATVEAASKLQQGSPLFQLVVLVAQFIQTAAQLGCTVHQVVNKPFLQRIVPRETKGLFKFLRRLLLHSKLRRLLLHSPGSDRTIVCVDQHILVDLLCVDDTLGYNANALCAEALCHKLLHLIRHCVWLNEDKGRTHLLSVGDL
mmetsp:Transcript_106766/g.278761  ORF Transcript_106766/g.278761 Transcript_106766/m.278761 type:complete len:229 (-) Transcript_106766:299-985(-)